MQFEDDIRNECTVTGAELENWKMGRSTKQSGNYKGVTEQHGVNQKETNITVSSFFWEKKVLVLSLTTCY